ncbi:hypothetical protein [Symbioplanes lichenis]|uniref:hypothetical protein n=1 Tax=Symbioplanes lichenis TaxID=1629072 RepID=UPI0027385A73|nr:hypothetical protein [Actinoplanes lichenis]
MAELIGMDSSDVAGGRRAVTLTDLVRIPVHRWKPVAAGALLGLLAGIVYLVLPARYEGVAVVAVRAVVTDPFSYPGPGADRVVNMTVENGIATGTEIVAAVSEATGQSTEAARSGLTVELPTGTQVLRFRYVAQDTADAIAGANAAANAYLTVRQALYTKQRDTILKSYDQSIDEITKERDQLRETLSDRSTENVSASTTALLNQLGGLDDQLGDLTDRRATSAAIDVTPGNVTRVAAPPLPSNHDMAPIYAFVAIIAGALAGAVGSFGLEGLDRRVRSGTEASAVSGFPLLADLGGPRFRNDKRRHTADLRYLSLAILGQLGPIPHRRIVLLSTQPGDLPTSVATGLALTLAGQGNTVGWEDHTKDASDARSRLVAGGGESQNGQQRNGTAVARGSFTSSVPVGSGRILLLAPPEPEAATVTVIRASPAEQDDWGIRAARESAAVVVVRRDYTRATDLERLSNTLRLTGVNVLGVVAVGPHD